MTRPTMHVKGLDLSALNPVHLQQLALFEEEKESLEPERIDKVEVIDDYTLRVYTSRFIELEGLRHSSSEMYRHLQVMSTYRLYDNDPDPDVETMNDPYADFEMDRRYREVLLSSVYRTLEGDEGWIVTVKPTTFRPDISPLHVWDGRV